MTDDIRLIRDPEQIAAHFMRHRSLHIYELGDLDPFFWPNTTWYGLGGECGLRAVVLQYASPQLPCLLALGRDDQGTTAALFAAVQDRLPGRYYAHLTPGLAATAGRPAHSHGSFLKMALRDPAPIRAVSAEGIDALTPGDLQEVEAFYRDAYPGNWFDARMLHTGQYFGIRHTGALVAVAGVHVYSEARRVAALGNIATHPKARGQGLARRVTARVCTSVLSHVDTLGLNVKADNEAALALYRGLGFETVGPYEEWLFDGLTART